MKASIFGLESGKILDEANIFNRTKRNYQGIENQTDDCSLTMFCWDGTFFSSAMMMMMMMMINEWLWNDVVKEAFNLFEEMDERF